MHWKGQALVSETGCGKPVIPENVPLRVLYINPAGGCNLHCKHCWVNEGTGDGQTLTVNIWSELFRQARELGCSSIKFTGGEPLLYPEVIPLYLSAHSIFGSVTVETNGTVTPPGLWEAFQSHPPFFVSTSIDSAHRETHDLFRGKPGAWQSTVNFAGKLVEQGINSQVIMSVSRTDRKPIADMVKLIRDLGVNTLKINFITPSGRGKWENFYQRMDIREVLDFFKWISDETPLWVIPSVPAALLPLNRLKDLGYCPVRNLMGVLPDGTFSLCGVGFSRGEMSWGKFPEVSVETAWKNSPVFNTIRNSLPDKLQGVCSVCIHRDSCIGRCIVNNNETGGSLLSPDALCQAAWEEGLFPATRLLQR